MKRRQFLVGLTSTLSLWPINLLQANNSIRIGVLQSLTGDASSYGTAEYDIIKLLAARENAKGGINGKPIELVVHDDRSDEAEARIAFQKLAKQGICALLGASTSGSTLALMPDAIKNKIPVLAAISYVPLTETKNPYFKWFFRTSTSSLQEMSFLFEKIVLAENKKRVAIFYEKNAYGIGEANIISQIISRHDKIDLVTKVGASSSASTLKNEAQIIVNSDPDIIILNTSSPDLGGLFVREIREQAPTLPIVGGVPIVLQSFIDKCGPAGEGVRAVSLGNWNSPSERQKVLGDIMTSAGLRPSGHGDLVGAVGFQILMEALKKVRTTISGETVRNQIEKICGFRTFTDGPICFSSTDHDGIDTSSLSIVVIKNRKFITI